MREEHNNWSINADLLWPLFSTPRLTPAEDICVCTYACTYTCVSVNVCVVYTYVCALEHLCMPVSCPIILCLFLWDKHSLSLQPGSHNIPCPSPVPQHWSCRHALACDFFSLWVLMCELKSSCWCKSPLTHWESLELSTPARCWFSVPCTVCVALLFLSLFLNDTAQQLFTQHLHCSRHCKKSRHDLNSTEGSCWLYANILP